MKKFLAKLALFTITSILLNLAAIPAYADEEAKQSTPPEPEEESIEVSEDEQKRLDKERAVYTELFGSSGVEAAKRITNFAKVFDDVAKKQECISKDEAEKYTWVKTTSIIGSEDKKNGDDDDFFTRNCFQNTFRFFELDADNKKLREATQSRLLKKCKTELLSKDEQPAFEGLSSDKIDKLDEKYKTYFSCEEVQIIFSKGGTILLKGYVGMLYRWGAGIGSLLAVLVIVISGIQLSASGGDSQAYESAKGRIIRSIAGLAVFFLSGLILYSINPTFFVR